VVSHSPIVLMKVHAESRFQPCDIRGLDYPTDPRISDLPIYDSLIERLKPIKKAYEHSLSGDMRRYRVIEPEIPSGIAIRNKRRKRARDQNLNVSSPLFELTPGTPSRRLQHTRQDYP
jgi:hypothetical protein